MKTPNRVACLLGSTSALTLGLILLLSRVASASAPQITAVTLTSGGAAVNVATSNYLVVPNASWGATGTSAIFIMPGASSGDTTTSAPTFPATATTYFSAGSPMFGSASNWGMMLLQFTSSDLGASMTSNLPTNANPNMLGGATGPVNKSRISLTSAIPSGTTVTFTVNMKSEIPHLVGVMGGTYPIITYDTSLNAGEGGMTIQTTTFDTTTNASDALTGMVGFMIMSDTSLGLTPLKILCQTNAWVGDIFPMMPGFDSSSSVGSGAAGTKGTTTCRCGSTIYGITGQTRTNNTFVPDAVLATLFGATATSADLRSQVNGSTQTGDTVTSTSNFSGTAGTRFQFTYTFASPKDATVGIPGAASAAASRSSSGTCFLSSTAQRARLAGWPFLAGLAALCALVGMLAWRRRALPPDDAGHPAVPDPGRKASQEP